MRHLIISISIIYLSISGFAQNQKLIPRDECKKDSSLGAFVDKLKIAIQDKDKQFILSVLDQNINNSFGGDGGIEEFKQMWDINSANSKLWSTMDKIISLGGVYTNSKDPRYQFVFPYVFKLDLEKSVDNFFVEVVTVDKLNVKEKPDNKSKTIGELSFDVVWTKYSDDFKPKFEVIGWTYIRTLDYKIIGYVQSEYLYSPIGYRMFLTKNNNNWKISSFVHGD